MEEIKLVKQFKGGDKSAFDALYEKYKNTLLRMSYLVSGNLDDAEDIVQETFVKCYLHIGDLKKPEGFRPWLFQILYRTAYRQVKKRGREIPDEDMAAKADATDGITSLDRIVQSELQKQVNEAVQMLGLKHRVVVVMYYYNEMTTKEIAKVLGCTEGTIKSRLFTSRNRLKKELAGLQEGDGKYENNNELYLS